MNTNIWGNSGWTFLHTITFNYPENPTLTQKNDTEVFFTLVGSILPCKYCRESYILFIKQLPIKPALESRALLTKWLFNIHNKVNNKLRRQKVLTGKNPTFREICIKYNKMRSKCSSITETCGK
jgi:hypothetical protein